MGWKRFKERFRIEHIIQISDNKLLIGSPYVSNLANIDMDTGEITGNPNFEKFLSDNYPCLLQATASEILEELNGSDHFDSSILVYTYNKGEILEKYCEIEGYPSLTHDGVLMHENTFSRNRADVVKWAITDIDISIQWGLEKIGECEEELHKLKTKLKQDQECKRELEKSELS